MKSKSLRITNKKRFIRQCPHCKSKKGYKLSYVIHGYGHENKTFSGKLLDEERATFDKLDDIVECLNCGKFFSTELIKQD